MTQQEYQYIEQNIYLLGNVKWNSEQQSVLFGIYNRITGENKPQTSCGRCVLNIKKRLQFEYEKARTRMER